MNEGNEQYLWLDDTYSFGGSSSRAMACPVSGYALYSPPTKGKGQHCHQVNRTGPFPVGSPGVVESGLKVSE